MAKNNKNVLEETRVRVNDTTRITSRLGFLPGSTVHTVELLHTGGESQGSRRDILSFKEVDIPDILAAIKSRGLQ